MENFIYKYLYEKKKRCALCGKRTYDWETRNGITRCWDCARDLIEML